MQSINNATYNVFKNKKNANFNNNNFNNCNNINYKSSEIQIKTKINNA